MDVTAKEIVLFYSFSSPFATRHRILTWWLLAVMLTLTLMHFFNAFFAGTSRTTWIRWSHKRASFGWMNIYKRSSPRGCDIESGETWKREKTAMWHSFLWSVVVKVPFWYCQKGFLTWSKSLSDLVKLPRWQHQKGFLIGDISNISL